MIWSVFNFITFENKNCISEWRYQNISNRLIFDRNLLDLALNNNQLTTFTAWNDLEKSEEANERKKEPNGSCVVDLNYSCLYNRKRFDVQWSRKWQGIKSNFFSLNTDRLIFFRYIIASLNTAFAYSATASRLQANLRIFILFLHFFSFILLFIATNDSDHFPLFAKQQDRKWKKRKNEIIIVIFIWNVMRSIRDCICWMHWL